MAGGNYGDTIFEDSLTPEVPIVQPVDNKAGQYLASGLAGTINNVNSLVFNPNAKAARAEGAKNGIFSDYAEEVSLLADAKDQGMSTDEAQRRLRVLQNTYLGNYPELADDFFTFSNKLMTENGLGGVIHKETPIETANRKKVETAVADGWDVSTPAGMLAYDRFKNNSAYLEQLKQKVDLTLANGQQLTAQTQAEATVALHDMVSSTVPWVNNLITTTNQQLKSVSDPIQRQALIDQAKAKYGQQAALLGGLRAQSQNAVDTSYLTAATDQLMTVFEDVATGKSDVTALTTANERSQAIANAIVYADPEVAAWIALDKASAFRDPNAIMALDAKKQALLARLNQDQTGPNGEASTSKPPDLVDKAENVALAFDDLKKSTTNIVNDKTAEPEAKAAQANKIVNTLRSVVIYGSSDQDAKNFTSVVDFLADPSVGKFMEQNKDNINPQIAGQAKYVAQQQYENVVLPLINERWLEAQNQIMKSQPNLTSSGMMGAGVGLSANNLAGVDTVDINAAIEPVWNGAGIQFDVKPEYRDNANMRAIAKELNTGPNSIAPVLNKMVRMNAHLSGNTDYKKIYDEAYATRLWQTDDPASTDTTPAPDAGTNGKFLADSMKNGMPMQVDNPSDLQLEDFSDEELQKIVQASKAKEPDKLLQANNPLQAAQAYLGMSESNPEQVQTLSRFIKNSAGIDINPAKTAWCAAFVDAVLGGKGTGKLNARSYLMWGQDVSDSPQPGDVVVLQRGGKDSWQGHVGFYMGTNPDGTIKVLGGNQGDSVSEDNFDVDKVLGFRRAG